MLLHSEEMVASVTLPQHFVLSPGQVPETNQQWTRLPGRCELPTLHQQKTDLLESLQFRPLSSRSLSLITASFYSFNLIRAKESLKSALKDIYQRSLEGPGLDNWQPP